MRGWHDKLNLPIDILADTRFLSSIGQFATWAQGRSPDQEALNLSKKICVGCLMYFQYRRLRYTVLKR